jgi:hypothetical protein
MSGTGTAITTADLLAPPLARMMRCQRRSEGVALSYIAVGIDRQARPEAKRAHRGSRLNDGYQIALMAWDEIRDLEPTVTHKPTKGATANVTTRPWRDGKRSAWTYLLKTSESKLWGGPARQMLANLEHLGITLAKTVDGLSWSELTVWRAEAVLMDNTVLLEAIRTSMDKRRFP